MKNEIEKIGNEFRNGNVGIETLKQIQAVKAKIIKQAHDTVKSVENKTSGGVAIALSWIDDAFAFGNVLGKHKKIGAEWQDMDIHEAKELQAYFLECLRKEGFAEEDLELLQLVGDINEYIIHSQNFFKKIATFVRK